MSTTTPDSVTVSFDPTAINKQSDIISGATKTRAGVMTAEQVQQLDAATQHGQAALAEDDVFIYADAVNGDDANPGTQALPVKTFFAAEKLIPGVHKKNLQIFLAPGTYEWSGLTDGPPKQWGTTCGPEAVYPIVNGSYTNEVGNQTVSLGSNGDAFTIPVAPAVDAYRGAWAFCVSGANAGARRCIVSNDGAGLFNLQAPFDNPVAVGDVMQIQRCAVTMNIIGIAFHGGAQALWQGVKINLVFDSGFLATGTFPNNTRWNVNGCEFALNGGAFLVESHSELSALGFAPWYGLGNPFNPLAFPANVGDAGCYMHDGFLGVFGPAAVFEGNFVFDNMFIEVEDSTLNLVACSSRETVIYADDADGKVFLLVANNGLVRTICTFDDNTAQGGGPMLFIDNSAYLEVGRADIENSQGDAVFVGRRATAVVNFLTGTTNAGFGLNVQSQAAVFYVDGNTTVTGAAGDVQVAANPPLTYAAITGGGGFTDPVALIRIEPN